MAILNDARDARSPEELRMGIEEITSRMARLRITDLLHNPCEVQRRVAENTERSN